MRLFSSLLNTIAAFVFAVSMPAARAAEGGVQDTPEARKVIASRIIHSELFQKAMRSALLESVRSTIESSPEKGDANAKKAAVSLVADMAFQEAFVSTFSAEELLVLEPIYTSQAGLSAVSKTRDAYTSFAVQFRRLWQIYGQ